MVRWAGSQGELHVSLLAAALAIVLFEPPIQLGVPSRSPDATLAR